MIKVQSSKFKVQSFGFTLIELLVVISIIGVLASLALVSYSGAQKQTRDTQRRSDLAQYRNALETYASNNNGIYPIFGYGGIIDGYRLCQATTLYPFMGDTCLTDPNPDNSDSSCGQSTTSKRRIYCYGSSADGISYVLTVRLETGPFWEVCSNGKTGIVAVPDITKLVTGECQVP